MVHRFVATVGDADHEITVELVEGTIDASRSSSATYRVTALGKTRVVDARRVEAATWSLLEPGGGRVALVDVDGKAPELVVTVGGTSVPVKLVEGRRAALAGVATARQKTGPQPVRSPMPGKVVKVLVKEGEAVKAGQGVIVVEAMKMENELKAPRDGTVVQVAVQEGATVEAGQMLATIG